jgi:DNA repair protein RecO (recombination protein O)
MSRIESTGIILNLRSFGERDLIAKIFTSDFGVVSGLLKAGQIVKKNKALAGQIGSVAWSARLDSQLGAFHFESQRNAAARFFADNAALLLLNSTLMILSEMLPEREAYPDLYKNTINLLAGDLRAEDYLNWEISFLGSIGYALNLTKCSNCGRAEDLKYISKRTGRAVCADCARPYLNQCLPNPPDLKALSHFLLQAANDMDMPDLPMARKLISNQ